MIQLLPSFGIAVGVRSRGCPQPNASDCAPEPRVCSEVCEQWRPFRRNCAELKAFGYENETRTEAPMTQKKTAPDRQADNPKANPSTDSNQIKDPSDWVTIAAR